MDVNLVHQSLPELTLEQIDLRTSIAGIDLSKPIFLNAMTGGAADVASINRDLSIVAAELGLGMAVGSQTAGIGNLEMAETYRVVRRVNPHGILIANLSAKATVDRALQAIEMIEADILQIHLNAPQELIMAEGDRDFRGQLGRIGELVNRSPVPVIVKECGFGICRSTVQSLYKVGVRAIDDGVDGVRRYLSGLLRDLSRTMLLAGALSISDLRQCPVVITGQTGVYCNLRGVDLTRLARR